VIAFATPKFCATRTCGPVVDIVSAVRRRVAGVTFIHVETYEENNPALGVTAGFVSGSCPPNLGCSSSAGTAGSRRSSKAAVSERELEAAVHRFLA